MAGTLMSKFNTATEGFSTLQKVGSVAMVAAIAAGVFFYANTTSQSPMAPLYTELTTADAASITEQLRDSGINYDITDRGATVRVPENDIYEARLLIERAGVSPSSQSDGFSTLDGLGITSTQFQQRIAYQRGLASEIENSLEEMASVDEARVNLVIPEQDLFVNDSIQASASVMLNTNSRLTSSQVTAIASLVSGAVEGLTREQVTITDQDGTVLTAPGATNGAPADDLERTRELEANIAGDVLAIVEAVAGPGNARVAVNATVDWSATSEVSEVFSPVLDDNGEQLRSAASTVIESDDPTTAEGILGTGDIDTLGVASTVRADVDADFLVDRSVKTVESNGERCKHLPHRLSSTRQQLTPPIWRHSSPSLKQRPGFPLKTATCQSPLSHSTPPLNSKSPQQMKPQPKPPESLTPPQRSKQLCEPESSPDSPPSQDCSPCSHSAGHANQQQLTEQPTNSKRCSPVKPRYSSGQHQPLI